MKIPTWFFNNLTKKGQRKSKAASEFNITKEYLEELLDKQDYKCALTGIELTFFPRRKSTASLDRIDSSKGYVEGNVQFVLKHVNVMKQSYDVDYFVDMCEKITDCRNRRRYMG